MVATDGYDHVGAIAEEAVVEGNKLPVGVAVVKAAGVDKLEVVGVLDEAASQRGGGGVHEVDFAVVVVAAAVCHVSGFELKTLDFAQVAETAGGNNDLAVAIVVVAVAGEIGSGGVDTVSIGKSGGKNAVAHDRIGKGGDGHIVDAGSFGGGTSCLHAKGVGGVAGEPGEGVGGVADSGGHKVGVVINVVGTCVIADP